MSTTETTGENDLEALTGAVVKRMARLFKPYPTWDRDALMSEGIDLAREAARTYQPGKSALSTWVSVVVWRGLKTIHRTAEREAKRDRAHGAAVAYHHRGRAFEDVDESLPVDEYISAIYRQAVHTAGRIPTGRGCRIYEPAQEAALLAIKRRLNLSNRGVVSYLSYHPSLVRSIRLKHLPSSRKIDRLCDKLIPRLANKRGRSRMAKQNGKPELIGASVAAARLSVSTATFRSWCRKPDCGFKVYRFGRLIRVARVEFEAWLESQATPAATMPNNPL